MLVRPPKARYSEYAVIPVPSPMGDGSSLPVTCSLIDVIDGLKDRSDSVEYATVEIDSVRSR